MNSAALIRGPSRFGLCTGAAKLACESAFGLKPLSAGLTNEYLEGWSYRKGGSMPMTSALQLLGLSQAIATVDFDGSQEPRDSVRWVF